MYSVRNCPDAGHKRAVRVLLSALALTVVLPAHSQVIPSTAETAETETPVPAAPVLPAPPPAPLFNKERILGVMPDFATVRDSHRFVPPLTPGQKFLLALKETVDPCNIATAFVTAAESQVGNETPKYGEGWGNWGRRVGAAELDFASQNFFSAGVMAVALHQDPRYYREGPDAKFIHRIGYSFSRLVIARQDSGRNAFNGTNIGGLALGIAASNAYYPSASRTGTVMFGRVWTSLLNGAVGNLTSEFWPDIQQRFFRHHGK